MAHFAELDENNYVVRVIAVDDRVLIDSSGVKHQQLGVDFCNQHVRQSRWIEVETEANYADKAHAGDASSSDHGLNNHKFAEVGFFYSTEHDLFVAPPPAPWFHLDETLAWVCPDGIGPKTGQPFTHNELLYIGHLLNTNTVYALTPVIPADNDLLSEICSTTEFRFADISEITHGVNPHTWFYLDENGQFNIDFQDKYWVEIDVSPIAIITAFSMKHHLEKSNKVSKFCFEQHPQNEAFSIHECFRLIVEWAYAYTELGNIEPMAKLAHDTLRAVQMPLDVRQELLQQVPPQVVSLFLADANIYEPFNRTEKIDCPPLFATWIEEARQKFPARSIGDPINIDFEHLPDTYPV